MKSIIEEKSFNFAVRVVKLNKYLTRVKKEVVISRQLLRSGTSIGANVAEAEEAQSKADFVSKMGIALKETAETLYWIRLLEATEYIDKREAESLIADCVEVKRILSSIIKTSRE